ncbi:COGs COG3492 [hydrothermal vent metagenome]|uniref:COGs COG3492 n=1 Tax=hydrothermal vent metagenome TaxID=652676 RepID=A0A3B0WCX4_9ZZZZ
MDKNIEIKAKAFDKLINHLDKRKDVQNIDLMILANFCRNCLSNWMSEAAIDLNIELSKDDARKYVYKMPYSQWKEQYQTTVTDEKLAEFNRAKNKL